MQARTKRYLHRKLATSVSWVALVVALFTSVFVYVTEFNRSSEKTAVMLNELLDTVENTAAIAAYAKNAQIASDVLKGLLRNEIVHEARFSDDHGINLREARPTTPSPQPEIIRILRSPFGNETMGRLIVVPEANYSIKEARHGALSTAFNSTLLIALTTLIVLYMVRLMLSLPLATVSSTLHAIRAGEAERLALISRNKDDELGQLIADINGLLDTLDDKLQSERSLRLEIETIERQLRSLFESTSAGIFLIDTEGRLITGNPTVARVLGLHEAAVEQAESLFTAFSHPDQLRDLMRAADEQNRAVSADLQLQAPEGSKPKWVHCLLSRQMCVEKGVRYEGVVYDITERVAVEDRIRYEADHDSLTGLLRRNAMERELKKVLSTPLESDRRHVMMLIDLDRFKEVNDVRGHDAGDRVLVEVATRLQACVRPTDLVARLGGDEFMIMMANCLPEERAFTIAREVVQALQKPVVVAPTSSVTVGASVGIAFREHADQTMEDVMKRADEAMYEVKRRGRNGFAARDRDGRWHVERLNAEESVPNLKVLG